jgi:hypothetical protein
MKKARGRGPRDLGFGRKADRHTSQVRRVKREQSHDGSGVSAN